MRGMANLSIPNRPIPVSDIPLFPILIAPNARLKAKSRPVGKGDDDAIRAIIPRMFATMYTVPGIGLAAPQVDLGLRLLIVDLMPNDKPAPITMINPEIVALSEELAMRGEGCLPLPGM